MTCILRVYQDRDDSIDCQDVVCVRFLIVANDGVNQCWPIDEDGSEASGDQSTLTGDKRS